MTGTVARAMHNPSCRESEIFPFKKIVRARKQTATYPKHLAQVIEALIFMVDVIGFAEDENWRNQAQHLKGWRNRLSPLLGRIKMLTWRT